MGASHRATAAVPPEAVGQFCLGELAHMAAQVQGKAIAFPTAAVRDTYQEVLEWFATHPSSAAAFEAALRTRAAGAPRPEVQLACRALLSDWLQPALRASYIALGQRQTGVPQLPPWQPPPPGTAGLGSV